MKDLISISFSNDLKVNSVNARELWTALGYTEEDYPFRKWVTQRFDDTMAEENVDFNTLFNASQSCLVNNNRRW